MQQFYSFWTHSQYWLESSLLCDLLYLIWRAYMTKGFIQFYSPTQQTSIQVSSIEYSLVLLFFSIVPSQLLFLWDLLDFFSTVPSVIFILGHFHSINSTIAHPEATGRDQSSHRRAVTQSHRPFSPFACFSYWLPHRAAHTGLSQHREHISKVAFGSIMLSAWGVFGVLRGC